MFGIPGKLPLNKKTASSVRDRPKNAPKEDSAEDYGEQHARSAVGWLRRSGQPGKTMAYER
jgi:hypothetical protein